MKQKLTLVGLLTVMLIQASPALALMFHEPTDGKNIVGRLQYVDVEPGDDFVKIGQRFDVGYFELVESNREVNPDELIAWDQLLVPTQFILPPGTRSGILVNLAELRLYYFQPGTGRIYTFPVGVGREGWGTPVCLTSITVKTENPTWHVPESIRAERAKDGVVLPKSVPPGPENPLGNHSLRLAVAGGTYLIHGTNDPSGVGRRSSSGCIRMFSEDIEELFSLVPKGTLVQIINEPYKTGWDGEHLYLEAHVPIKDGGGNKTADLNSLRALVAAAAREHHVGVNWPKVMRVAKLENGIPTIINTDTGEDIHKLPADHPEVVKHKAASDEASEDGKVAAVSDESVNLDQLLSAKETKRKIVLMDPEKRKIV